VTKSALPLTAAAAPRATISIVEDDPSVRPALARLLRTEGMDVETFASAEEFLADDAKEADCLILDVRLPGLSGLWLFQELRRVGRGVPVVFVTANDDPGLRERALGAGAIAFLLKPFQEEVLLEAIARAIGAL
jgi:FixJ family two-component response regulator